MRVDRLRPGTLHAVDADHAQAGGKGINVARTLVALGVRVQLVVLVGGESGQWILRDLELAGLRTSAVHAPGDSRTCLEVVDTDGEPTQLHGMGVDGSGAVAAHLAACVSEAARSARWVVFSGSLPRRMPPDEIVRLISAGREAGAAVAVDTSGAALRAALGARPDLVRVNHEEAGAAGILGPLGFDVIVSDGAREVRAWDAEGRAHRATPPTVRARNTLGCGDAMLGGFLASREAGMDFDTALRRAVGVGAAQAESPWAGKLDVARAMELAALAIGTSSRA
jgi:fructose-1-phosphate kinase PfkB-like protein